MRDILIPWDGILRRSHRCERRLGHTGDANKHWAGPDMNHICVLAIALGLAVLREGMNMAIDHAMQR